MDSQSEGRNSFSAPSKPPAHMYSYRRRGRYSLRVPKPAYTSITSKNIPRSLESIDDWTLYRTVGSLSNQDKKFNIDPRGARRVQSFRCTSKGSVVKLGDFYLGNASPENYLSKEDFSAMDSHLALQSPTCSRKSSNSIESLKSSKVYQVFVAGYKRVGKHTLMSTCLGNSSNGKLKATILIDFEQFNIIFNIIEKLEEIENPNENLFAYQILGKKNQALLIIYSVTDRKSFEKAGQILTLSILRHYDTHPNLPICLIANKTDLVRARVVTTEEGKSLANRFDARFIETSAEIGENIEEIMVWIVEKIKENLSVLSHDQGSKLAEDGANKAKLNVVGRAGFCIQRFFKRFIFKSNSRDNMSKF